MALCVAIYDKDDVLLFLRLKEDKMVACPSEVQRFLHCSCDIAADKSFAYLTNTGTKFFLVTDAEEGTLKDHEIRLFFKNLHAKYCNAISNPFYAFGSPLSSSKIDAVVKELFASF
uniref:Trafficking protein particle complex subunit n=1 Tax=Globodera rostochiensis TaxID=31243 RepID=A0A914HBI7_GLORO